MTRDLPRRAPPDWLLEGILLSAVVFGPLAFGAVEAWSKAILEGLLFGLALLCLWRGRWDWSHPVYKTVLPAVLVVLAIGFLQYLNPRQAGAAADLLPSTVSKAATGRALVLWSAYACLLLCAPQVLSSPAAVRRFAWTALGVGAFIALLGILQKGTDNSYFFWLRRAPDNAALFGSYTNKNHAASLMAMSACLGFGVVSSRLKNLRWDAGMGRFSEGLAIQTLLYFLVAMTVFGVIRAESRGATHALVAAVFVTGLLASRFIERGWLRWLLRGGLFGGLGLFAVYVWGHPALMGWILQTPDNPTAYRLSMYRSSWQMVLDQPLFGYGLGGMREAFAAYKENLIPLVVDHVHNDWLETLLQTGFVGSLAIAVGLTVYLWQAVWRWLGVPDFGARCLAAGMLAAVAFFSFHGLVEFAFQIPANAVVFLVTLSALAAPCLLTPRANG